MAINKIISELPFFSIIIPVRNGESTLAKCLDSIKGQSYPANKYEIIIADGMSTDDTVKISQDHGAKVIKNNKLTVGPGRNEGFKFSVGELIAFSDDDCVMDRDWLINSVNYFEDEKVGGLSGPTITQYDGGHVGEAVGLVFELAAGTGMSAHRSDSGKVEVVGDIPGCNAIYRRKVLEKIFPIDEELITADDVERNRLVRQSGFKLLYVPDVKLWHYRRQNILGFFKQIYRFAIGRLQVGRKNLKMLQPIHILAGLALPLLILAFFISINFHIVSFYLYISFTCLLIIVGSIYAFFKTGSIWTAVYFPLVIMITIVAWSLGFMRELLFPQAHNYRRGNA
jgi:succinoglycan biosynthesis protein ExoA